MESPVRQLSPSLTWQDALLNLADAIENYTFAYDYRFKRGESDPVEVALVNGQHVNALRNSAARTQQSMIDAGYSSSASSGPIREALDAVRRLIRWAAFENDPSAEAVPLPLLPEAYTAIFEAAIKAAPDSPKSAKNGKAKTLRRTRKTRLTARQKEVLETYWEAGKSPAAAARLLGTSRQYVSKVVKESKRRFNPDRSGGRSVAATALPTDKHGQVCLTEESGKADGSLAHRLRVAERP